VFWPKDLLKKDVPTARVLTFGYDADVVNFAKPASRNTVEDHATNLVKELMFARERTGSVSYRMLLFRLVHRRLFFGKKLTVAVVFLMNQRD
jgi:protein SERAC1